MRFERKMASVKEFYFGVRDVALECLSAWRQKKGIVLAPGRQQRWAFAAKVFLELGVERHVARIIEEQVELDLVISGARQQCGVEFVSLRCQERYVLDPVGVLPLGRLRL